MFPLKSKQHIIITIKICISICLIFAIAGEEFAFDHAAVYPIVNVQSSTAQKTLIVQRHTKEKINSGEYIIINYHRYPAGVGVLLYNIGDEYLCYCIPYCISFCTCTNHTYIAHTISLQNRVIRLDLRVREKY